MATDKNITEICKELSTKYSVCDISDALLKLKIPNAGHLPDIHPIPGLLSSTLGGQGRHIIAPVSTILFVPKDSSASHQSNSDAPAKSNIPKDKHWTDMPSPGNFVVLSQPEGQVCAVSGDIMATRLKVRGLVGIVADGRVRDVKAMRELSSPSAALCGNQDFTVWSKGTSTVGTGLEAKAWAADVPVRVGGVVVRKGDVLCADEGEDGVAVIPHEKFEEVVAMLEQLKEIDDKCVADVQAGVDVAETFRRHR